MGSYATVYLSDGRPICTFRNGIDQLFFLLFTRADWVELSGPESVPLLRHHFNDIEEYEARVAGYRTTVSVLRDRLDLVGVPLSVIKDELVALAQERAELLRESRIGNLGEDYEKERLEEIEYLGSLTWESWLGELRSGLEAGYSSSRWTLREPMGTPSRLMSLWEGNDERFILRAVLEALPADEVVTLDLADLIEGGWLDSFADPRVHGNSLVAYMSQAGLPPIILTEGRFDAEVLSSALSLLRPHLVGYVRLPDFNQRNEGGAVALRQTLRAFASAGIPNRVVALFDNDTAAIDVLRGLPAERLPANICALTLPRLALAESYPTIGPQGHSLMDINGVAVSIELFLGQDVLLNNEALQPVLWGGYFRSLDAYQGAVSEKETIQRRFRDKVAKAREEPDSLITDDWRDLDMLLDYVLGAASDLSSEIGFA